MNKIFAILVVLLCTYPVIAADNDWMGQIDDDVYLYQLSIPGTHDSGALHETFPDTAKCQKLTITQQLECGTRFLDIRCRRYGNTFKIYHGMVNQHLDFEQVVDFCKSFLKKNPSETILMLIKEEYEPKDSTLPFEEIFYQYISEDMDLWYLKNTIPTLGNARGKIVLIRRFKTSQKPIGIDATNWKDNKTFVIDSVAKLKVQDKYHIENGKEKWNEFSKILEETAKSTEPILYLNYTSGYKSGMFDIPKISAISNYINPLVDDYFTKNTSGRFGVIVMDFATKKTNELIYSTNKLSQ